VALCMLVALLSLCFTCEAAQEFTPGVVTMDALTFSRVVNGRKPVLVRFDARYTDPIQEFVSLALKVAEHPSGLLLADMTIYQNDPYVEHPDVARCVAAPPSPNSRVWLQVLTRPEGICAALGRGSVCPAFMLFAVLALAF
jgi:hypothetical protein